jgi:hypothetical protein
VKAIVFGIKLLLSSVLSLCCCFDSSFCFGPLIRHYARQSEFPVSLGIVQYIIKTTSRLYKIQISKNWVILIMFFLGYFLVWALPVEVAKPLYEDIGLLVCYAVMFCWFIALFL